MARRTLLSAEQRTRLFGIPTEAAEMAKHSTLNAEDLALVRTAPSRQSPGLRGPAVRPSAPRPPARTVGSAAGGDADFCCQPGGRRSEAV